MFCSFVLPAYKIDYFDKAIKSILNQSEDDWELIIVDDASPDNLISVVERYKDSRIRFYRNQENIGGNNLVNQWNIALSYAQGDYVVLASDDDMYSKDYLKSLKKLVETYPSYNVYASRKIIIDENDNAIDIDGSLGEELTLLDFATEMFRGRVYSSISNFMFSRETLIKIGGFVDFPLAWFSDDATVLKCANKGIIFSSVPLFYFRFSGKNISSNKNLGMFYTKINSTILFYKWGQKFMSSILVNSTKEEILFRNIGRHFKDYLRYRTELLIRDSDWKVFWQLYRKRRYMPFVNTRWLFKEFIKLIIKK